MGLMVQLRLLAVAPVLSKRAEPRARLAGPDRPHLAYDLLLMFPSDSVWIPLHSNGVLDRYPQALVLGSDDARCWRLYRGATSAKPLGDMFSFVSARPADGEVAQGFPSLIYRIWR
jgi:hypothetical protein